jgi:hypothetical protein
VQFFDGVIVVAYMIDGMKLSYQNWLSKKEMQPSNVDFLQ